MACVGLAPLRAPTAPGPGSAWRTTPGCRVAGPRAALAAAPRTGPPRAHAHAHAQAQPPPSQPREGGRGCRLVGTGSATPSRVLSNDFLASLVDTNDDWIATRTGIRNRRVLSGSESMTQLSAQACRQALAMGGVVPEDVDLLLLCTSSPDDVFGGACLVQREVGLVNAVAFDLTAACSGFVLGLITASRFILGGGFGNVLVVGADALSRYVDWADRSTCILFGDATAAALLRAAEPGEEGGMLGFSMRSDGHGHRHLTAHILAGATLASPAPQGAAAPVAEGARLPPDHTASTSTSTSSSSSGGNGSVLSAHERRQAAGVAQVVAGGVAVEEAAAEEGSRQSGRDAGNGASPALLLHSPSTHREQQPTPTQEAQEAHGVQEAQGVQEVQLPGRAQAQPIAMNGREVYKFAVTAVPQVLQRALDEAGLTAQDIDWLLLHQANQRILDAVAQKMGVAPHKVLSNVASYGNTSAASVPLALDEAVRSGKVKPGDIVAMAGFGAGLTWVAAVIRFG